MSFLDSASVNTSDPQTVRVHEILIRAYADQYEALAIAGQIGILKADIAIFPRMRQTWWSILEEAARTGLTRRLMEVVLQDPTIEGYHDAIREALETSVETLAPPERAAGEETESTRRGGSPVVGERAQLWPLGHTLKIRFLDGEPDLHKKVEEVARQWISHANLNFDFGDYPDAEVRVSFRRTGSWAYEGTNALKAPDPEPNVNFGWLTPATPQQEIQRVVLHEFGHLLGLLHEHGNPLSNLAWNKEAVYQTYAAPPNNWTREQIDRTIFEIWPPGYFPVRKLFDPASIMMFPIPAEHLRTGSAVGWNLELSPLDKQFAAAIYPLRSQ